MMLNVTPGAKYSAILGLGGYRPRRVVDNAEICTMIDSSDEWIRTRSGIIERRWASDDETIQMMSLAAARKALDRAGIEAGPDRHRHSLDRHPPLPNTRDRHHDRERTRAKSAAAFDISAACAGFCYATAMADSFIRSGASKYVLIVGVERLTDMTNRSDRSTAFLFADGAGAAVIGPSDSPGIGPVVWGSDGDQALLIQQTEPWDAALAWDRDSYRSTEGESNWPTLKNGRQPSLQVGLLHDGQDRRGGAGRRRRTPRGPGCLRPAPGKHADHRCHVPRSQTAEPGRRRPRHRAAGQYLRRIDSAGH